MPAAVVKRDEVQDTALSLKRDRAQDTAPSLKVVKQTGLSAVYKADPPFMRRWPPSPSGQADEPEHEQP